MDAAEELAAFLDALPVPQPHLKAVPNPAALLEELRDLTATYPGGIAGYLRTAAALLREAHAASADACGVRDLWPGPTLHAASVGADYMVREAAAEPLLRRTAFVLVAGGLGERLGYSGIKVKLPVDTALGNSYLQHYCQWIGSVAGRDAAVAIMTSDDTHTLTDELLKSHANFGLDHVRLLKQDTVPCLADVNAALVLKPGTSQLLRKPHGHGDVHTLLHNALLLDEWERRGVDFVAFFQDTNAAMSMTLPQSLWWMQQADLAMAFTCIPRKSGEAVGALASAVGPDGVRRVQNVEYNVFDSAYAASHRTDPAAADLPTRYPGSINTLLLRLSTYAAVLRETGGKVPEFINPKFTDAARTAFKAPTRVESLMQDIAQVLPPAANVAGVLFDETFYSPVKNKLADGVARAKAGGCAHCAATGEADVYSQRRLMLSACGVQVPRDESLRVVVRESLPLDIFPVVAFDDRFGPLTTTLQTRFPTPQHVSLTARSVLVVEGDVTIEALDLDGAVHLRAPVGTKLVVRQLRVRNAGWRCVAADDAPDEVTQIRGFRFERDATSLYAADAETTIVDESPAKSAL